jgi:uncharacterized membrane protein YoaK (UPF0700 family)
MRRRGATGVLRGRDAILTSLSLAAGCVDAVGFLGLGQVFVANMTGNTVLLGLAIGQADGRGVLHAGLALAGFVLGVAVGAAIVERGPERAVWTPAVTAALGLECVILVAFAAGWLLDGSEPSGLAVYFLIVLSALAMGVQSAAVRRLDVADVSTTYITGTLTSLTARTVRRLRSAFFLAAAPPGLDEGHPTRTESPERGLPLTADVWLAYGVGAVVGGAAELLWQPAALLLPIAAVAAVVALMATRHHESRASAGE